tara:strand:- start:935 stop:1252 length:318 start_codon:yes stop_codon:yes gene_type:complete
MKLYKLPEEVICLIFEYDGRYKRYHDDIIIQIKTINEWYEFTHRTLCASIPNRYHYSNVLDLTEKEIEYYIKIIKQEFKDYYFKNEGDFLKRLKPGTKPNNFTTG